MLLALAALHEKEVVFTAGVHTGPVVGAVAGYSRRFYRLFGDTVVTASRMCSHAPPHRLMLSERSVRLLPGANRFSLGPIESRNIKGKGEMRTCLVHGNDEGVKRGLRLAHTPPENIQQDTEIGLMDLVVGALVASVAFAVVNVHHAYGVGAHL